MKRKICVITGSRAEFGLLRSVMQEIKVSSDFELQVLAVGMHLSEEFGLTYREIEESGFVIDRKIGGLIKNDSPITTSGYMGNTLVDCTRAISDLKPDLVLVLGDRFEIFAAATSALISKVPIAHIHGGEVTIGAMDEAFRHSITKMSHIHFTATEEYRRRVIQLGENPRNVHMVGAVGIDDIRNIKLSTRKSIEQEIGIKFKKRNLLVTFHPATLEDEPVERQMSELLKSLQSLTETALIFTYPNADTGGSKVINLIEDFVSKHDFAYAYKSLGRKLYLSCMQNVDGIIGNSSSGIIEAPSLGVGTINIGKRQLGRIQSSSIINCNPVKEEIDKSINRLFSEDFKQNLKNSRNPYDAGGATQKILKAIRLTNFKGILQKEFHDL